MIIELLSDSHDRSPFDCGNDELNAFLTAYASTWSAWDIGRTFVAIPSRRQRRVVGYYTLGMASVSSPALEEKLGVSHVPVVLLDRLAVDKEYQGKGIGAELLVDALDRAHRVSRGEVAAYAVFVEALDDAARGFYVHYGFEQLEDDPHHLFITMKTIEKLFTGT
jgi:GNAT superfamily N-acetyltransferase